MAENESLYQRARDAGTQANAWLDRPVFPRPHNAPRGGGFSGFVNRLGRGTIQGAIPSRGEAILRGPNVPGQVLGSVVGGAFEGITDAVRGSAWYQRMFGNGNNSTMGMEENSADKGPRDRFSAGDSGRSGGVPVKQPGRIQNGVYIYPSAGGSPRPPTSQQGPAQGNFAWNPSAPVTQQGDGRGPMRDSTVTTSSTGGASGAAGGNSSTGGMRGYNPFLTPGSRIRPK